MGALNSGREFNAAFLVHRSLAHRYPDVAGRGEARSASQMVHKGTAAAGSEGECELQNHKQYLRASCFPESLRFQGKASCQRNVAV